MKYMHTIAKRNRDLYDNHRPTWIVLWVVFTVLSGFVCVNGLNLAIDKAYGATGQRMCTHNPDMTCAISPHRAARLFRDGHYTRASGFTPKKVFRRPNATRAIFIRKAERYYNHAGPTKRRHMRARYNVSATSRGLGGSCLGWGVAQCVAHRMWHSLTDKTPCGSSRPYPDPYTGTCVSWDNQESKITKKQVQNAGDVGWCAGNAYFTVTGAMRSPEGPAPLIMLGWGASQCFWTAWELFGD